MYVIRGVYSSSSFSNLRAPSRSQGVPVVRLCWLSINSLTPLSANDGTRELYKAHIYRTKPSSHNCTKCLSFHRLILHILMRITGGVGGAGGQGAHGGAGGKGCAPDLRFFRFDQASSNSPDSESEPRLVTRAEGGRGGAGGAGELMGGAGGVGENVLLPDLPPEVVNRIFGHIGGKFANSILSRCNEFQLIGISQKVPVEWAVRHQSSQGKTERVKLHNQLEHPCK
ncbi:hypothetical protein R3P38DRAFT_2960413 [Favolaschia claudopus]|uniref:F-box domain-containing protein n=1 Tax=Favolaschia claudopus TaxID=2862362 RepID=A0AAW0B7Z9_9AGAR